MEGKDNVTNVEHDSYFLSLKIWDSALEPEGHSEPKEEVRSVHASKPSLDRCFAGDPAHHILQARLRLCPTAARRSERMKPKTNLTTPGTTTQQLAGFPKG